MNKRKLWYKIIIQNGRIIESRRSISATHVWSSTWWLSGGHNRCRRRLSVSSSTSRHVCRCGGPPDQWQQSMAAPPQVVASLAAKLMFVPGSTTCGSMAADLIAFCIFLGYVVQISYLLEVPVIKCKCNTPSGRFPLKKDWSSWFTQKASNVWHIYHMSNILKRTKLNMLALANLPMCCYGIILFNIS